MRIKNHRIDGLTFLKSAFTGEVISPEIVVLHDTAGRLELRNSARYLASNNTAKASVHFVIERNGEIVQLVPTNRKANHAGDSSYHGKKWCNVFSIGIELVNPGKMTRASATHALAWWGERFDIEDYGIREMATPQHGHGLWMPHSEAQIKALLDLLTVLFRDIPSLKDITTHWFISPGRKVDPNPTLTTQQLRAMILGPDEPGDELALKGSEPLGDEEFCRITTAGSGLNMRRWPNTDNDNILLSIPNGEIVPVERSGTFAGRTWLLVQYDGLSGWILGAYTETQS